MELKRVVVTGLGAITPLGNTLPETREGIINGKVALDLLLSLMHPNSRHNLHAKLKASIR